MAKTTNTYKLFETRQRLTGKYDRSELTHALDSSEQDTACEKSVLYYDLDLITYKLTEFTLVIIHKTL